MNDKNLGGILLAAGRSVRLGRPKQLVEFGGQTLLDRTSQQLASVAFPAVAVISNAAHQSASLPTVANTTPELGMGRSLKLGLSALLKAHAELDAVLVILVDQYRVTTVELQNLVARWVVSPHKIVASSFGGTLGPPVIFPSEQFVMLQKIEDRVGAKRLLQLAADAGQLRTHPIPSAAHDLDTLDDLHALQAYESEVDLEASK